MNVSRRFTSLISRKLHALGMLRDPSTATDVVPPPSDFGSDNAMSAWTVRPSGKIELEEVKMPIIRKPSEVLVKVMAVSVNPIDVAMLNGYGKVVLNTIRQIDGTADTMGKTLILGRDFAGEIVAKGNGVRNDLMVGDLVYGVVPPHMQGCHAEMVVAEESLVSRKPGGFEIQYASGVLYAGLTAWSALFLSGDMFLTTAQRKRALVIGASGGVGSSAVQLLKAWGAEVVATCRTDAVNIVGTLSPDTIIDYTSRDALHEIASVGKYDIILDASGSVNPTTYIPLLKDWSNAKFITLRSPFLKNTDSHGLMVGMMYNAADFVMSNVSSGAPIKGTSIRWAFFAPLPTGVKELARLVNLKKFSPLIDSVFEFNDLPAAYEKMSKGHARGKIIVTMNK